MADGYISFSSHRHIVSCGSAAFTLMLPSKYAFMVYNVAAKMTIFKNLDHIDAGVEIVPVKSLADEMSSGVSHFEQFVWDLEQRGTSNIDVPVLVLGVDV